MQTSKLEYRSIPDSRPDYLAGSDGYIYRQKNGNMIKLVGAFDGQKMYLHVWFYPEDPSKPRVSRNVHNLVCLAFHGPKPGDNYTVSHENGDRLDNRAENLCWETQGDNLHRKIIHGTHDRGTNNSRACLTEENVQNIRTLLAQGHTHQSIADTFGVSRTTVSRIKNNSRYSDI